ncbi:MAG: TonB-dependent receptor [Candidatus Kapabacteria bacterium]|nr:TonB-dependent receptor [Candidatus Kapabacteria bacterium]
MKVLPLCLIALCLISTIPARLSAQRGLSMKGRVLDAATKQPLGYTTITVFNKRGTDTSIAGGALVAKDGGFTVTNLKPGMYRIRARYIGYTTAFVDSIRLSPDTPQLILNDILLAQSAELKKTVTVEAEKELMQNTMDARVYTVGKDLTVAGGTLTDVLQNVPSVTVDQDRSIQLRGNSNVTILVDGKPSMLVGGGRGGSGLDQIPADAIESIEIITNPSAKYDAEGMTGIINIVMRKESRSGFNGSVSLNAGTRTKYTPSLTLNYKTDNVNVYSSYSFAWQNFFNRGTSNLQTFASQSSVNQTSSGDNESFAHTPRIGADIILAEGHTLSTSVGANLRKSTDISNNIYLFESVTPSSLRNEKRDNNQDDSQYAYDANLGYKYDIAPQQKFSIDGRFSESVTTTDLAATQLDILNVLSPVPIERQKTFTDSRNRIITLQSDYQMPLGGGFRIETGVKNTNRFIDNDFRLENFDFTLNSFFVDARLTNRVQFTENVAAGYASISGGSGGFTYSAGLRAENTAYSIDQITSQQRFDNDYFSVFPSAFLRYKLNEFNEIGISYSRRITRPSIEALNPFAQFSDPFNFRLGNPYLLPEFSNVIELTGSINAESFSITPTLYHRRSTNSFSRFRTIDSGDVTRTTFVNLATSQSTGMEMILQSTITEWWRVNVSGNVFYQQVDADNLERGLKNSAWAGNTRFNSNVVITESISAQLSYMYNIFGVISQGTLQPMYNWDIAVRYEFLDKAASLSLRVSDIFDTRQFGVNTNTAAFNQEFTRKRESRIGFLTFSYRFGIDDSSSPRRPQDEQPRMDDGGGM